MGTNGIDEERGDSEFREFKEFREALSTFIHKAQPLILSLNSLFSLSSLSTPFNQRTNLSREIISCQKGAECYTRQKCHRWVVLDVRPIGGIFSRGRNRPLITRNYFTRTF
jgi:hypothetical protein